MTEMLDLIFGHRGRNIGRPDGAGHHGVDPNTPLAELNGQRLGKRVNSPFGSRVIDQKWVAHNTHDATRIDNGIAFLQVWQGACAMKK